MRVFGYKSRIVISSAELSEKKKVKCSYRATSDTKKGLKDPLLRHGGCQHHSQSIGSGFPFLSFNPLSWEWDKTQTV